jgi:3',5'-cyclic AMP phosphodiesterase CpdA
MGSDDLRRAWGLEDDGPLFGSVDCRGIHLVRLYTHETKDVDVRIDAEQLAWLQADLAATQLPVVVLMHHSAADQDLRGNRWFDKAAHICLVRERKQLRAILEASGRVRLVLNGHLHWNHFDLIGGIPYVTLQSLIENVDDDAPGTPAAAWAVIQMDGGRIRIDVEGVQPVRYQLDSR